jgi:hypothetical protein
MKKYVQITSLSDDMLRTLGLIHDEKFNIAAALLSNENTLENSVVQLVAFLDIGVSRIKDRITLKNLSI